MKIYIYNLICLSLTVILITTIMTGCRNDGKVINLVEERDSLKAAYEVQRQRLSAIDGMISTINGALDSIAIEEGMLFMNKSEETPVSRNDVLQNLERYEQVLRNQQNKIRQLENLLATNKDIKEGNGKNGDLQELVRHMKVQLEDKDAQINRLRIELSKKDVNISQLRRQVESQRTQIARQDEQIAELDRRSKAQTTALARQDEVINQCYVLIGSKNDLKRKGVVRKNRLLSDAALDKSKFAKVDIRKFREISFTAKRPRILTDIPPSAYTLTTTGDRNFTLRVNNATAFWSISNFLVIQTD